MNLKRVLFINMNFYGYDQLIKEAIESSGFIVDTFCDNALNNLSTRLIKKIFPESERKRNRFHQSNYIKYLIENNIKYDKVFVIVGRYLEKSFLEDLKVINPDAEFILYLWDDIARVENYGFTHKYYDRIFTFDKEDAEKYSLIFLPLFYIDDYKYKNETKDIDLYFTGRNHSERIQIIKTIIHQDINNKYNKYFYLFSGRFQYLIQRIIQRDFSKTPNYIHYDKLELKKNTILTKRSRVILDIQYASQRGLTIRTFESIAAKSKLITTNNNIKEYDFYNPQNIKIVNRYEFRLDKRFMDSPYIDIPDEVYEKYSLRNWVNKIFN